MMLSVDGARFTTGLWASAVSVAMLASGCTKDAGSEAGDEGISGGNSGISSAGDGDGDDAETGGMTSADTDVKFDMPDDTTDSDTEIPCGEGDLCECEIPPHTPCDANANTPLVQVIGLNCPGDTPSVQFATTGSAAAIGTRS